MSAVVLPLHATTARDEGGGGGAAPAPAPTPRVEPAAAAELSSLELDPGTFALAKYAFQEARRLGSIPADYGFEAWMVDAIYERAACVARALRGINQAFADLNPLLPDGEGIRRGFYLLDE